MKVMYSQKSRTLALGKKRQHCPLWLALLCSGGLWLLVPGTAHGQLFMDFQGPTTISPGALSVSLSVQNTDESSISIKGVNFFVVVENGGPIMRTTPGPGSGVDLRTGTLFSGTTIDGENAINGQNPFGDQTPLSQGWGVSLASAVTLAPGETRKLATISFDALLPSLGVYTVDFTGTSYSNPSGGFPSVNTLTGTITVVPEPQAYALVIGLSLVVVAAGRRWLSPTV